MPASSPSTRAWPLIAAALLMLGIFGIDLATGPAVDADVLYVVPLLVCSFAGPPATPIYTAWIASMLAVVGLLQQPVAALPATAVWNRAIALTVIWTTAAIVFRLRQTSIRLQARTRDLADMSYALDQSAIVATTNTRGTITFANDRFCEISKYSRDELLGRDHRILNSGYHPKEFMRDLWTTIGSGRIWRGEIRNRAKDGSLYWVDTTIVPFLDDAGQPYQYMAIRYEITARKRSEDLLREQEALARLGQMAAVVAHEVKNPIAGIRGALQVIAARMAGSEARDRAIIGDIIARLDALNGIVQDLLLFARPRTPHYEVIDLRSVLDSTVDLLRRDPAFADVTVAIAGGPLAVSADGELLRILFQNVLLNAAQAVGGRGTIDVELSAAGNLARIAIRDHGPGMPAEVREKAFDAFFTTKHRGTGLGLPIARRVAEGHGGRISIDAPQGGGTCVLIELPNPRQIS